ncbi:hypothetical protein FRC12_016352 [Ceratobasidium sp. 428]|nr:hypothetical protein FRC09_005960 [Ceratobasidium sp. 395]KAG8786698.1 hypothetical protein FRC12_016352 [Ceratobasidium sp. 428]
MSDYTDTRLSAQVTDSRSFSLLYFFSAKRKPTELTAPVFPLEIIEQICEFLFAIVPPKSYTDISLHSRKPLWSDVSGFMGTAPEFHAMGYVRWVRILKVRTPNDWERISQLAHLVLELDRLDGVFTAKVPKDILTRFPHLRAVSVNAHNDVVRQDSGQFAYRSLFKSLPPSLLRLEITCAHGPDLKFIEAARDSCPGLLVLRLGRCTMFNRSPACEFWTAFPFDHDAYIAAVGTDDYAHSVAQALASLPQLKALRLGVYFMHSTIVLAHRVYHMRGLPEPVPVEWQQALFDLQGAPIAVPPQRPDSAPLVDFYHRLDESELSFGPDSCTSCHESFQPSRGAERRANAILKELLPDLEVVEWMDWFSPSHTGVSQHSVGNMVTA